MSGKNNVAEVAAVPEVSQDQISAVLTALTKLATTSKAKPEDPEKAKERRKKEIMNTITEESKDTNKIIIPTGMTKLEASQELFRQHRDEENKSDFLKEFSGPFADDIMVAIKKVSEKTFGWIQGKTIYSFFGNTPPTYIEIVTDIKNGVQTTEQCFYGKFAISAWEGAEAVVSLTGFNSARINISAKKKYSKRITQFFDDVSVYLKHNSIYKGKCISMDVDPKRNNNIVPILLEVKTNDRIFLNDDTDLLLRKFIVNDFKLNGKRTYLFTGDFGNGKTETAMRLGKAASEMQGYTFIYMKTATYTKKALEMAKVYEPALLFIEDIEQVTGGEERDGEINEILNMIDGVDFKGAKIKTFFTTNFPDKLNKAFRRPGRTDMVVPFDNPDDVTRRKILASWVCDLNGFADIDWDWVMPTIPVVQAAVIAEIGLRARKLGVQANEILGEDLKAAALSMKPQIEFMRGVVKENNTLERAAGIVGAALMNNLKNHLENQLDGIASAVGAN